MFGISDGGYLTRWQLENQPALYEGRLDWEGTLFRAAGPNLLTYLPTALQNYPAYAAAHQKMLRAGFAKGSEFLWAHHYSYNWDLTQRIYGEEFDPAYGGALKAGRALLPKRDIRLRRGPPLRNAPRPREGRSALGAADREHQAAADHPARHLRRAAPIDTDSTPYDALIDRAGRSGLHRYYRIEDGNHVDGL